jgi:ATP-dependent RNA helicase RhlE
MLQRLAGHANHSTSPARHPVRALVLTPTRELAAQVEASVRTYGKHLALRSCVVYGGVGMTPQVETLRRGVDILVATPGRLLDHVQQKTVDLSRVEILVLDEADRMLDMGFIRDIRRVLALLPAKRQNLLFSATFSDEIRKLADGLLTHPVAVEVARRNADAELVTQRVYAVAQEKKRHLLAHLIRTGGWEQVLVFSRTKHGASRLAEQLCKDGISATAIHGNKSQPQRLKALAEFKQGEVRALVATDIAARGLDIDALPHVVNFDLPHVAEDYVHRIGRTGRAGHSGEAVSLVGADDRSLLAAIEKLIGRRIERAEAPGFGGSDDDGRTAERGGAPAHAARGPRARTPSPDGARRQRQRNGSRPAAPAHAHRSEEPRERRGQHAHGAAPRPPAQPAPAAAHTPPAGHSSARRAPAVAALLGGRPLARVD